jgi:endonuclease/exonuclease/phosphatase (EEP) superfamily protein YafD
VTLNHLHNSANQNHAPVHVKKKLHREWSSATFGLLIGLAGLLIGRLGHLWIAFDVFSQFSMQFIFLTIAMAIGMVFPRFKGLAGTAFFIALLVLYSLWPQFGLGTSEAAAASGTQRLKVASFNTYYFNTETKLMTDEILRLDADVMTLLEFGSNKQAVLDAVRTTYPYQENCFNVSDCDAAIISKFPLTDVAFKGGWQGPPLIRARLGEKFGSVTVFGVHTTRFPHSRAQFTQVNALVKYVESVPGRSIIMGDFNSTPFSRINQTISSGLELTRLSNLPSWPTDFDLPQLAIDHIFVSKDIIALGSEHIGNAAGSDHYPISITLAVPQN